MLVGCTTTKVEYVTVPLPSFSPSIPERPELELVEEVLPPSAILNTLHLMTYAQELEAYGKAWREFYGSLTKSE